MIEAIKYGDPARFHRHIADPEHFKWFLGKGIYLTLRNRCQVLIWRSLFRRTFLVTYEPSSKTTYVPCSKLLRAFLWGCGDDSISLDDIECMCISLIDQGYVEGYIMHSKRFLVLKRAKNHGFKKVSLVCPDLVPNDDDARFIDT